MTPPNNTTLARSLVDVCHRLYAKGFVTATDGNVSVRLPSGTVLATRSGINKGMVTKEDLVEVGIDGGKLSGSGRPSTELGMHLFIYQEREDVQAVVHAHPTYATGFATARLALDKCLFPEVIVGLGTIPLADYATPSTPEVAQSLSPFVKTSDAILLTNHGAVTYGADLYDAFFKMEKVEHAAHIAFVARMLGGEKALTVEEVDKLRAVSTQSYGKDASARPACVTTENLPDEIPDEMLREYIRHSLEKLGLK